MQCGAGLQARLDAPRGRRVQAREAHTGVAQHLQPGLDQAGVVGGAQQDHVALAAFIVQVQLLRELVQLGAAVEGQPLQARAVGPVERRMAGAQPAAHPIQFTQAERQANRDGRMAA